MHVIKLIEELQQKGTSKWEDERKQRREMEREREWEWKRDKQSANATQLSHLTESF